MIKQKQDLRKKLIASRLAMDKTEVVKKSLNIINKLLSNVDWQNIHSVHVYTSLTPINEIDTTQIKNFLAETFPNIKVASSPARRDAPFPTDQYDLIIVPILGFDKQNNRLGMGGGWYDRFLSNQTHAQTIGLAYKNAQIDNLPIENHDVALDQIITE